MSVLLLINSVSYRCLLRRGGEPVRGVHEPGLFKLGFGSLERRVAGEHVASRAGMLERPVKIEFVVTSHERVTTAYAEVL